jgi:serine/threonine protein kinase
MTNLTDHYRIDNYNDTFALGHYARVLDALDQQTGQMVAFKVLRPEHLTTNGGEMRWEYRAFANEVDLLTALSPSPQVVQLHDCGFLESSSEAPTGGAIQPFGDDTRGFIDALPNFAERGWRPYLALENLPRTQNLFYVMRPDKPGQRYRMPTEEGLSLALQFGMLLREAHAQRIVYLDHKLEHVYWDGLTLRVIDLNSSRRLEPHEIATYARMDIHNLCVGILYPAFTGLSPQKTALRPQPGTLSDVESRYAAINTLDFGIEPTLSVSLQTLLQLGAAQQIASADEFIAGIEEVASGHGWHFADRYTSDASRDAREQLRAGLARLRQGQENLREARELFREAAIIEGISPELEAELRRLVRVISDMYQNRVIP